MKKIIALFIIVLFIFSVTGCKKCYYCRAYKEMVDKMVAFDKACDESEFQAMEDSFRLDYPDSLGYYVICR